MLIFEAHGIGATADLEGSNSRWWTDDLMGYSPRAGYLSLCFIPDKCFQEANLRFVILFYF